MIETMRFGVNYKAGKGQTVEVIINEGQTVNEIYSGLDFEEALNICMHLEQGAIGREQRYKTNGKGGGFLYIGTKGTIKRYHGGQALFVSDTGAEEKIPTYGLDKI